MSTKVFIPLEATPIVRAKHSTFEECCAYAVNQLSPALEAYANVSTAPPCTLIHSWLQYMRRQYPCRDAFTEAWEGSLAKGLSLSDQDQVELVQRFKDAVDLKRSEAEARRRIVLLAAVAICFDENACNEDNISHWIDDEQHFAATSKAVMMHFDIHATLPSLGFGPVEFRMRVTAKRNSESGEYHASDELRFLLMRRWYTASTVQSFAPMQAPVVPMPEPGEPKRAFVGAAMANVIKAVSMVAVDELMGLLAYLKAYVDTKSVVVAVLAGDCVEVPLAQFTPEGVARALYAANEALFEGTDDLKTCLQNARCTVSGADNAVPIGVDALVLYYVHKAESIFVEFPPNLGDGTDDTDDGDDDGTDDAGAQPPAKKARVARN